MRILLLFFFFCFNRSTSSCRSSSQSKSSQNEEENIDDENNQGRTTRRKIRSISEEKKSGEDSIDIEHKRLSKRHEEKMKELQDEFSDKHNEAMKSVRETDNFMSLCAALLISSSSSSPSSSSSTKDQQHSSSSSLPPSCQSPLLKKHLISLGQDQNFIKVALKKQSSTAARSDRLKRISKKHTKMISTMKDRATRHHLDEIDEEVDNILKKNPNLRKRDVLTRLQEQIEQEERGGGDDVDDDGRFLIREVEKRDRKRRLHHQRTQDKIDYDLGRESHSHSRSRSQKRIRREKMNKRKRILNPFEEHATKTNKNVDLMDDDDESTRRSASIKTEEEEKQQYSHSQL